MSLTNSSASLLISRSALHRLSKKYPNYLERIVPRKDIKKESDSTPWGLKFKIFASSCAIIAIPYSMGIVISASPSIRNYLNDDDNENLSPDEITWGRRIVNFVRWYWGEDDSIPYFEYLERQHYQTRKEAKGTEEKVQKEVSLSDESSAWNRLRESNILRRNHETYNLHVYQGDQEKVDIKVKGTVRYHEQEHMLRSGATGTTTERDLNDSDQQILIAFQDGSNDKEFVEPKAEASFRTEDVPSSFDTMMHLTNVFSAWHYFQNMNMKTISSSSSNDSASSSKSQSHIDIALEQQLKSIHERLNVLQEELRNPSSMRAYDDISDEIQSIKQEERQIKSERRKNKLKSIFRGIFS